MMSIERENLIPSLSELEEEQEQEEEDDNDDSQRTQRRHYSTDSRTVGQIEREDK